MALESYTVTSLSSDVTIVLLSCKTTATDMPVKIKVLDISKYLNFSGFVCGSATNQFCNVQ